MAGQFAARLGAALAGSSALAYSLSHGRSGGEAKPKAAHQASAEEQERPSGEDQLRLVQVVFRHGARTPLASRYWQELVEKWDVCGQAYEPCPLLVVSPNGRPRPFNEDDFNQVSKRYPGGCSKGELTKEGQLQAQDFGRWLRWRYVMIHEGFLPEKFQAGCVAARTTNYARTIATLKGVLTGLYPGPTAPHTPVTAVTLEAIDEMLYANLRACERLKGLIKELSREHRESRRAPAAPEVQRVEQVAREVLRLEADEPVNFVSLHDAITTAAAHGKPLPPELQDRELQRVVEEQATKRFLAVLAPHVETGRQQEVLRLSMGRLMQLMIQRMDDAASGKRGPKLHLFSGHDSSVMLLLVALGKELSHWPPYMSHVVFELWRRPSDGVHYVKVLYDRKPLALQELCPGPASASGGCELHAFKEHVLGPYLLTQEAHRDECMVTFHHDRPVGEAGSVEEHDYRGGSTHSAQGAGTMRA
ncbi:hypothetical protein N2152v2_001194 [Parachlorella kessleri]